MKKTILASLLFLAVGAAHAAKVEDPAAHDAMKKTNTMEKDKMEGEGAEVEKAKQKMNAGDKMHDEGKDDLEKHKVMKKAHKKAVDKTEQ